MPQIDIFIDRINTLLTCIDQSLLYNISLKSGKPMNAESVYDFYR